MGQRIYAQATARVAGSTFFFFALLALQGTLSSLLRPTIFSAIAGYLQGGLVAAMLSLMVLSFRMKPVVLQIFLQPEIARWTPPVWFLGLYQTMTGDSSAQMLALAAQARGALVLAVLIALGTYVSSYHRHRKLSMEGAGTRRGERRWLSLPARWLVPEPRISFGIRTLERSSRHPMLLMGYGGLAAAALLVGVLGISKLVGERQFWLAAFVYYHILGWLAVLLGSRHLYSTPVELRANWIFQLTESEGRNEWLAALDTATLTASLGLVVLLPLPLAIWLTGWRGAAEMALTVSLCLPTYEWAFRPWDKLPFTCSVLPGKTPMWVAVSQFLALLAVIPIAHVLMLALVERPHVLLPGCWLLLALWWRFRRVRRDAWEFLRLRYDDVPEPSVHSLGLGGRGA